MVCVKDDVEVEKLICDVYLFEEVGCFGFVFEKIFVVLVLCVVSELIILVIGIGVGGDVDGQVLVIQDMLGMNNGFCLCFFCCYVDFYMVMIDVISYYVLDVKNCDFLNEKE